ncbi:MAG: hypothetical protein ACLGHW_09185 [Gammaproteobacteria bacterium]|jgi:hypothetical protein
MSLHAFGFDSTRLHALFAPRKPRHPLLRGLAGLLGLALLALLVVAGVLVGAAMLAAGLLLRPWRRRARPLARARRRDAMDAEYRVIERGGLPHPN